MRIYAITLLVAAVVVGGLVYTKNLPAEPPAPDATTGAVVPITLPPSASVDVEPPPELETLAKLTVSDARPGGYKRDLFGPAWADVDHNGCNQRQDTIMRDTGATREKRDGSCYANMSGHPYVDPYTGLTLTTPAQIQIDHVVSLGDAWRSGANVWTTEQRKAYANDLDVLWAVQGAENERKSDKSPDQWLPPSTEHRCDFERRYVSVKIKYGLTITTATHKTLDMLALMCGS